MRRIFFIALLLVPFVASADDALWALLQKGGQVVLIRHALTTPGVGDPPEFKVGECATQRNLSDVGRADAVALGVTFRTKNIPIEQLLSSPWCRCIETSRLAFKQEPVANTALSNLFGRSENEAKQVASLKALVARKPGKGNVVMVTHGSTIVALTGVSPAPAEMVIVTPQASGGFKVAGRIDLSRR